MKKILKKMLLGTILAAVIFFGGQSVARAQENNGYPDNGFTVTPLRYDWNLYTGESRSGVMTIKNLSKDSYKVEMQVEDFYVTDDSTSANFFVPNNDHPLRAYDMINWVTTSENNFEIGPEERKELNFTVNVPDGTPTGGYYGGLFAKYFPKNEGEIPQGGSVIKVETRLGMLLVLGVKGVEPIKRAGELIEFNPAHKIFFISPTEVNAKFSNTGNMPYKISGNVEIKSSGNEAIASIPIDGVMSYPDRMRNFNLPWNFKPWDFGKYVATIYLQSDEGDIKASNIATFWVIPWQLIIAVIVAILIIADTFFRIKKRLKERKEERQNK